MYSLDLLVLKGKRNLVESHLVAELISTGCVCVHGVYVYQRACWPLQYSMVQIKRVGFFGYVCEATKQNP